MAGASLKSNEHLSVFHQSIQTIFDGWTGLQLAVRQGFGGPHSIEKAEWMVDAVYNWFMENDGIESFELEDFLADILDHEFDTIAEDDSLNVIATSICTNFDLCKSGHHQSVLEKIKQTPAARLGDCVADETEQMEEDDGAGETLQDANMQAMLGGMRLGGQSHDQQLSGSHQVNGDVPGTSSAGATGGAAADPVDASSSSRQENHDAHDEGWTVVRKSKKK